MILFHLIENYIKYFVMSGQILENDIWNLVDLKDVCIKETNAKETPVVAKTLDECAKKCSGITDLFAYGTHEFGGQGCQDGLCKCNCISEKDDTSANCQKLNRNNYWFFEYKKGFDFNINGKLILFIIRVM